ncbi:hypothetical protein [Methylobrevis pamukkalensis]|uniref:Uncharacterized protein n=1 Tax=Methylobrevis pamukkalensis TaxID=1439726 RepID=A0A1E3H0M9_9HYPH|nr:hypothetical protein [Methylobrevis pamukkalensis]ODN69883.1 hypothetical protein A6302_02819 [Methylobrevis pamukkalensis]
MRIAVRNSCAEADSFRSAYVRSLFNCDTGANFTLDVDLPIENDDWQIGLVVGPSGSGKTSIGRLIWGDDALRPISSWPGDLPIIDAIKPGAQIGEVTTALTAVGLGSVRRGFVRIRYCPPGNDSGLILPG